MYSRDNIYTVVAFRFRQNGCSKNLLIPDTDLRDEDIKISDQVAGWKVTFILLIVWGEN